MFSLADFDYDLPTSLIAQKPLDQRTDSKLIIVPKSGRFIHDSFNQIENHIPDNSVLIYNNTKVMNARIKGDLETGGSCELLILAVSSDSRKCFAIGKPLKKLKKNNHFYINSHKISYQISDTTTTIFELEFKDHSPQELIELYGTVPLPPYIERSSNIDDKTRYQTVFASQQGSAAAPTAGLHFDSATLDKLTAKGCQLAPVTLHIGPGTFFPVKTENISEHQMHAEEYMVPERTYQWVEAAKANNKNIICIGTTSFRALESFYLGEKKTETFLKTELFIHPTSATECYQPRCCNGIITNFHQPKSTLFMLICALIGTAKAREVYQTAIKHQYRFLSYGDCGLYWL